MSTLVRMAGTEQGSVYVVNITSIRWSERYTSLLSKTRADTARKLECKIFIKYCVTYAFLDEDCFVQTSKRNCNS